MNEDPRIEFKIRVAIFVGLWLLAGLVCGVFAELIPEAGLSEFDERAPMVYLVPLYLAYGMESVVVPKNDLAPQDRQFWETVVGFGFLLAFAVHACIVLTRKGRREFVWWSVVQVGFLAVGVAVVLYVWHLDVMRGHG